MNKIEIDGVWYHAQEYDNGNLVPMLDELDRLIPETLCICFARERNECCCGAWDDVDDWNLT